MVENSPKNFALNFPYFAGTLSVDCVAGAEQALLLPQSAQHHITSCGAVVLGFGLIAPERTPAGTAIKPPQTATA